MAAPSNTLGSGPNTTNTPGTGPTVLEQTKSLVAQTVEQVSALASQAANSQTTADLTAQAKSIGNQAVAVAASAASTAGATASSLAGQAHAQAHAAAPSIVPAPAAGGVSTSVGGVDKSGDLHPASSADQHKLEQELAQRPSPSELVNKGILNADEAPPTK
ncbi:uncharacterized protein MKK02DRAFT_31554 [Dioszegia hungarica]|uniref:Uncharacterized protein n=1 Tax=Dioszegia hungarica TaxID=4972 RepID=A0AA38HAX0_9TREE|nr:uncharacterized protein MKK02DRAFT_31554 [Dioszegia hungarica]KAI9638042.1 hypothetical protein MKK02DRAFT_31554 [Dioszegia hungarica]